MTVASERTDLYPSRTATEVTIPRKDPVVWSPQDAPGPITRSDLQSYDENGFLAIEELITPE
ncbi:multidrug DMT transporter permease, partial [Streptomyces sp. NRRL F-6602]